jgi:hypothetical protein
MKRRHSVLLLVALGCVGSMACGDRTAPTEPARGFAEMSPEKTVAPGGLLLGGRWGGTITFHAYDGNTSALACDGRAPVSLILEQDGATLSGRFRTACAGELAIHGRVDGSGLFGSLDSVNGPSLGRISGTVAFSRIAFKTTATVGDNSDGSTNRGGDQTVVSSEVELHRESSEARAHPVLADVSRPAHAIDIQR